MWEGLNGVKVFVVILCASVNGSIRSKSKGTGKRDPDTQTSSYRMKFEQTSLASDILLSYDSPNLTCNVRQLYYSIWRFSFFIVVYFLKFHHHRHH